MSAPPPVEAPARQVLGAMHGNQITHVLAMPDGLVATASKDSLIRLWAPSAARAALRTIALGGQPNDVQLDPTTQRFVAWVGTSTRVFEMNGKPAAEQFDDDVTNLEYVGGSGPIRWIEAYNDVRWYDAHYKLGGRLPLPVGWDSRFALATKRVTGDGRFIVALHERDRANKEDDVLLFWSTAQPSAPARVTPFPGGFYAPAVNSDGTVVAADRLDFTTGVRTRAFVVTLATGARTELLGDLTGPMHLTFSPDDRYVMGRTEHGDLFAWNVMAPVRPAFHRKHCTAASFRSSNDVAAACEGMLVVLDPATGNVRSDVGAPVRRPRAVAISGNEVTTTDYRSLTTWSLEEGKVVRRAPLALSENERLLGGELLALDTSRDGVVELVKRQNLLSAPACGTTGQALFVQRLPRRGPSPPLQTCFDGVAVGSVDARMGKLATAVLAQDEQLGLDRGVPIITGDRDITYDAATGHVLVARRAAPCSPIVGLEVRGASGTLVRVLELPSARPIHEVRSARFSPDGRSVIALLAHSLSQGLLCNIVMTDPSAEATAWDIASGKVVANDIGVLTAVDAGERFAIAGPGRIMMKTSAGTLESDVKVDGTAQVIRSRGTGFVAAVGTRLVIAEAGMVVFDRDLAAGTLHTVSIARDGKRALVTAEDGSVRVFDLDHRQELAALIDFADDEYVAVTPHGAFSGTSEVAERIGWVFEDPVEYYRFEQFAKMFASPELVRRRLRGETVDAPLATARPPRLGITASSLPGGRSARVVVSASSKSRVDVVRVFVEGRLIEERAVCGAKGDVSVDVPLFPGANGISAVAFDDRGQSSNPASVTAVGAATARKPDLYLVSVGIDAYPKLDASMQLDFAGADARAIADAFATQRGKAFGDVHATTLIGRDATVGAIDSALATLAEMRGEDLAVIFLAGHGYKADDATDMVFLTGQFDRKRESLKTTAIGWPTFAARLRAAKGRVLVLLDACHSGHLTQELLVPNDALASSLQRDNRAGVVVFAAAKGRQPSYEPRGERGLVLVDTTPRELPAPSTQLRAEHGFFTGAILASLTATETDANGDRGIQLSELVDDVTRRVRVTTNGLQTPWVARRELFGDFSLTSF